VWGVHNPSKLWIHVLGAAQRPRTGLGRELGLVHDQVRQVLRDAVLRAVCPGPTDEAVAPTMIPVLVVVVLVSPLFALFPERPQQHVQPVLELVRGRRQLEAPRPDGNDPEPQVVGGRRAAVQAFEHGPDVVVAQPLERRH
jgi:hypothetical protein